MGLIQWLRNICHIPSDKIFTLLADWGPITPLGVYILLLYQPGLL